VLCHPSPSIANDFVQVDEVSSGLKDLALKSSFFHFVLKHKIIECVSKKLEPRMRAIFFYKNAKYCFSDTKQITDIAIVIATNTFSMIVSFSTL
jgi:hypothetical protein